MTWGQGDALAVDELTRALDTADVGWAVTDHEGVVRAASEGYLAVAGVTPDMLESGAPWFRLDAASPQEKDARGVFWSAFLKAGEPWRGWVRWHRADGTTLHFEGTARVLDADRVVIIGNDRTDRLAAERALEENEALHRTILEDLPLSVALQDTRGRLVYVNSYLPRRLGVQREEVIGKTLDELRAFLPDAKVRAVISDVLASGREVDAVQVDSHVGTLAGTNWLFFARPLRDRSGKISRFLTVAVDRTASHRLAREREDFARALAETQKITALNDFAGSLAHELSNVLHPVGVYARALQRDPDRADRREFAGRIAEAAMTAGRILRRTLTMARTETGRPRAADAAAVVREVVASARDLAPDRLTYALDLPEGALMAIFQATELRQVMVNLLNNAADACRQAGTVTVSARLAREVPPEAGAAPTAGGPFVVVSVRDEGTGLDAAAQRRAFQPFYTTKAEGLGTGLGLPVVLGLTTAWGGAVTVESVPGHGATFSVWIPAAPVPC